MQVDEVSIIHGEKQKQAIIDFYTNNPFRIRGKIKQSTLDQIFKEINEDCLKGGKKQVKKQLKKYKKYNAFCKKNGLHADRPASLEAFLNFERGGQNNVIQKQ